MPNLENGYTRIANELLEAIIKHGFTLREQTIILAIIRKTYGYNKKTDDIAASQISKATGIQKNHIRETIKSLESCSVVFKKEGVFGSEIGLNKDYQKWTKKQKVPNQDAKRPKSGHPKSGQKRPKLGFEASQIGIESVPNQGTTKDNLQKTTKQKNKTGLAPSGGLPEWLPENVWLDFVEHRATLKPKLTVRAADLVINKLEKIKAAGFDPVEQINKAIEHGWKTAYIPDSSKKEMNKGFSNKQYTNTPKEDLSW